MATLEQKVGKRLREVTKIMCDGKRVSFFVGPHVLVDTPFPSVPFVHEEVGCFGNFIPKKCAAMRACLKILWVLATTRNKHNRKSYENIDNSLFLSVSDTGSTSKEQGLHVWRVDTNTGDVFYWKIPTNLSPKDNRLSQMENNHRFMANFAATNTFWDFDNDGLPWEPQIQEE